MLKTVGSYRVRQVALACAALVGGFSMAAPAKGALVLSFAEGSTTVFAPPATINNGIAATTVTTINTLPSFSINIASATSNAPSVSGIEAYLEESDIQITDSAQTNVPVSLTVTVSDTGYQVPSVPGNLMQLSSALGGSITAIGNASDTVSLTSTVTPTGGPPQSTTGQTSTITQSNVAQGFNVPNAQFDFLRSGIFDLSNVIVINLSNSGDSFTIAGQTTVVPVPEPASCALALLGASSMLLGRRRRLA
jgi:hypothetical protein